MKKDDLRAAAAIALFYLFIESLGITCPIRFLTGISCAGCGMSRAWLSLLRGDLAAAFAFHPLFWLPVPAAAALLLRQRLSGRPDRWCGWFLGAACGLFVAVYLFRLLSPGDRIVVFQPAQGQIVRLLAGLLGAGG